MRWTRKLADRSGGITWGRSRRARRPATKRVAMVGLTSGMIVAFRSSSDDGKGNETILTSRSPRGTGTRAAPITTRPLPGQTVRGLRIGGRQRCTWSRLLTERRSSACRRAGRSAKDSEHSAPGPCWFPPAIISSTASICSPPRSIWTFPSGARSRKSRWSPIRMSYIVNTAGNMSLIDPQDGRAEMDPADPGRPAGRDQRQQGLSSQLQPRPVRHGSRDRPDAGRPGGDPPACRAEPPRFRPGYRQSLQ